MKCLYQARKVSGPILGVDFASFCDIYILFWNCSENVEVYGLFFDFLLIEI